MAYSLTQITLLPVQLVDIGNNSSSPPILAAQASFGDSLVLASSATTGTVSDDERTISPWDGSTQITNANIAFIDAHTSDANLTPQMPQLELQIKGLPDSEKNACPLIRKTI